MSAKPQFPPQKTTTNKAGMSGSATLPKGEGAGATKKQQNALVSAIRKKLSSKSGNLYKINEFLKKKFCTEQEVIGVEIQPDIIRVCQAKQTETGWEIVKLASANALNNPQQEGLKKNKDVYSKILKDLFEKNKITNTSVALSIPAAGAIIKTISLPLMPRENLDKATKIPSFWQNLVQISDNLADYSIYYKIIKENAATKEMDVLFIASKLEELKTYIEIAKDAGLEPCVIDVGCFSINNLSKLRSEVGSDIQVYLKVGRDENYLQVLEQGKPYIYDLFVSDNEKSYLNEFLENATFQQRFISQLTHTIAKHQDKQKVKIDKISVISSELNIDKFIAAIAPKVEGIEIAVIDLLDNIKLPEALVNDEEFKKTKSSYAIPVGLATRNLNIFADEDKKNVSETVNLIPGGNDVVKSLEAKFYSKIAIWVVTIICTAFIFFFTVSSINKFFSVSQTTVKFNSKNQDYTDKKKIYDDITAKNEKLKDIIKIRSSLKPNQDEIIKTFSEIGAAIPEGVWIEEMGIATDGKISITGRSFEERGIITFSKSFDESDTIADVYIANLKSTTLGSGSIVKEFLISGALKSAKAAAEAAKAAAAAEKEAAEAAKEAARAVKQPNGAK